jgi:hypothetical protein
MDACLSSDCLEIQFTVDNIYLRDKVDSTISAHICSRNCATATRKVFYKCDRNNGSAGNYINNLTCVDWL